MFFQRLWYPIKILVVRVEIQIRFCFVKIRNSDLPLTFVPEMKAQLVRVLWRTDAAHFGTAVKPGAVFQNRRGFRGDVVFSVLGVSDPENVLQKLSVPTTFAVEILTFGRQLKTAKRVFFRSRVSSFFAKVVKSAHCEAGEFTFALVENCNAQPVEKVGVNVVFCKNFCFVFVNSHRFVNESVRPKPRHYFDCFIVVSALNFAKLEVLSGFQVA